MNNQQLNYHLYHQYQQFYDPSLLPALALKISEIDMTPSFGIFCSKIKLYDHSKLQRENQILDAYHILKKKNDNNSSSFSIVYQCLRILSQRLCDLKQVLLHVESQGRYSSFWKNLELSLQKLKKQCEEKLVFFIQEFHSSLKGKNPSEKLKNFIHLIPELESNKLYPFLRKELAKKTKQKLDRVKRKYNLISKSNKGFRKELLRYRKRKYFCNLTDFYEKSLSKQDKIKNVVYPKTARKQKDRKETKKRSFKEEVIPSISKKSSVISNMYSGRKNTIDMPIEKQKKTVFLAAAQNEQPLNQSQKFLKVAIMKTKKSVRRKSRRDNSFDFIMKKNKTLKEITLTDMESHRLSIKSLKEINQQNKKPIRESFRLYIQEKRNTKLFEGTLIETKFAHTEPIPIVRKDRKNGTIKSSLIIKKNPSKPNKRIDNGQALSNRRLSLKKFRPRSSLKIFDLPESCAKGDMRNQKSKIYQENKDRKNQTNSRSNFSKQMKSALPIPSKHKKKSSFLAIDNIKQDQSDDDNSDLLRNNPFRVNLQEIQDFQKNYIKVHENAEPALKKLLSEQRKPSSFFNESDSFVKNACQFVLKKMDNEAEQTRKKKEIFHKKMFTEETRRLQRTKRHIRELNSLSQKNLNICKKGFDYLP